MWEAFNLWERGVAEPFSHLQEHRLVAELIVEGAIAQHLSQPRQCPNEVYQLMTRCWQLDPADRPTFAQLAQSLMVVMEELDPNFAWRE